MPKYRQLHTKIIDSFDFNEMPNDFTRVTWMLLPLVLDGEGRGIYNTAWLKAKMYPIRLDVTDEQIKDAFAFLLDRKMVVLYEVEGRQYFYIPTFKSYQKGTEKEAKSVLPAPQELVKTYSKPAQEEVCVAASASASDSVYESDSDYESVKEDFSKIAKSYESEIGGLTPLIAEELTDALKLYPAEWMVMAFAEAAKHNKRSWAYAHTILKRWKVEGHKSTKSKPGTFEVYNG